MLYIDMNRPLLSMCPSQPEPLSYLPPHPIPLGCPQAPALGALLHASNLHWSSILHVVMYMLQGYSLKSSHPHLLPLSPKVCSFHLCLLCCPTCRIIGTVFLNSTYELIHSIRLSLNDLLHSIQYTLGSSTSLELTQRHSFL